MKYLKGISLLLAIAFLAQTSFSQITITPDIPFDEYNLDEGRYIEVYVPDSLKLSLLPTDFTLLNGPANLNIFDVQFIDFTNCRLLLVHTYEDFDVDFTNLQVQVESNAFLNAHAPEISSNSITIIAIDENPVATITPDIALTERNLGDGRTLDLNLSEEWFSNPGGLLLSDFTWLNAPAGISLSNLTVIDSSYVVFDLAYTPSDFETDFNNVRINIDWNVLTQSGSNLVSSPVTITGYLESITIVADSVLTEERLDVREIGLKLVDEVFVDWGTLLAGDFDAFFGPGGVTIESAMGIMPDSAVVQIAFDGRDFDADDVLQIGVLPAAMKQSTGVLWSNTLDVFANLELVEPVITNVSIPASTARVGDVVTATITVDDDLGSVYTLFAGSTIGDYTLENLQKTNNTTYTADFTINEGGNDYASLDDIPVNLVLDNSGLQNTPYVVPISQAGDIIDANSPVISDAAIISIPTNLYSRDKILIQVQAIEDGLTVNAGTAINGISWGSPNLTVNPLGGGNYDIEYTIAFGDADATPGTMPTSIVLEDAAGNTSSAYTGLSNNIVNIDANNIIPAAEPDAPLDESNLNDRSLLVHLRNDYFIDTNVVTPADFAFVKAPTGTGIEAGGLDFYSDDSVRIHLEFDGTDFDADTVLVIGINAIQLANSGSTLETPPLPVTAVADLGPQILNVAMANTIAGIGANVPVSITVEDDLGSIYTLAGGTIGGYTVTNLSRISNTVYTASFTVTEGGNSYAGADDVPVTDLQLLDGATPGNLYNGLISQAGDLIDAVRPVINSAEVLNVATKLYVEDTVKILVHADSNGYELGNTSTINGQTVTEYTDNGDSTYTLFYPIQYGDPKVLSGALVVSIVLKDGAENLSIPLTVLDANVLEIHSESASFIIAADSVLEENSLDGRIIQVKLQNEMFIDYTTLSTFEFVLVNAPAGMDVNGLDRISPDSCNVILQFDGTDFTDIIPDFHIYIDQSVLKYSTANLFSTNSLIINPGAAPLLINYTKTDISQAGAADGSIDLTVSGGVPPYTYAWSNGAFMEDLDMLAAGVYTVDVSDSQGANATETIDILGAADTCTFHVDFSYSVTGSTVTFTNLSGADQYNWQFGDGKVSDAFSPTHTYSFPGLYEVCLLGINSSGDCVREKCIKIEVGTVDCAAGFGFIVDTLDDQKIKFVNTTSGAADAWYWNFGDGITSTERDPEHIYSDPGHYVVCLNTIHGATGCQSSSCLDITVGTVETKADFTYFVDPATRKVTFTDNSTGNIASRYWIFGDGEVHLGKDTVHQYPEAGLYTACLIVSDTAGDQRDELCHEIQVGTPVCDVVADFSYFVDAASKEIRMTDLSSGNAQSWFWDFGDGTTSSKQNPRHTYADSGLYKVTVSVRDNTGNCFDFHTAVIQVGGVDCQADFTYTVDPNSKTVKLKQKARGTITDYFWYLDDGNYYDQAEFSHTYKASGKYNVSLTVLGQSGQCMDYVQKEIQVGSIECKAGFTWFIDSASNEVQFRSKIIGNATDVLWTFGDGHITEKLNPVYRFPAPGYYSVGLNTFNSANGCMDYYEEIILIGSQGQDCKADFIYQAGLGNKTVNFTSKSLGDISEYLWDFGDGITSSSKNPTHLYSKTGNIWVCLTVVNSAEFSDILCRQIQVSPAESENCLADFIYTVDSTTRQVTFRDKSFGEPDSWSWDFDDGSTADMKDPAHTYASSGYYTVTLDISNSTTGCSHTTLKLINVSSGNQGIRADYIYEQIDPDKKADTYPVDFVGTSLGDGSKLKWDFGDGTIDTTTLNPTHQYPTIPADTTYEVCFTVSNPISGDSYKNCQFVRVGDSTVNTRVIFDLSVLQLRNHPNPLDERATISYQLAKSSDISLELYDFTGRKVKDIENAYKLEGYHSLEFIRERLPAGIYILKLRTPYGSRTSKMIMR